MDELQNENIINSFDDKSQAVITNSKYTWEFFSTDGTSFQFKEKSDYNYLIK